MLTSALAPKMCRCQPPAPLSEAGTERAYCRYTTLSPGCASVGRTKKEIGWSQLTVGPWASPFTSPRSSAPSLGNHSLEQQGWTLQADHLTFQFWPPDLQALWPWAKGSTSLNCNLGIIQHLLPRLRMNWINPGEVCRAVPATEEGLSKWLLHHVWDSHEMLGVGELWEVQSQRDENQARGYFPSAHNPYIYGLSFLSLFNSFLSEIPKAAYEMREVHAVF